MFRDRERFIFALTYGADVDWIQNVIAAGRWEIPTRRQSIELSDPKRFTDPKRMHVPVPARWIVGLIHVNEFIALKHHPDHHREKLRPVASALPCGGSTSSPGR